MSSYHITPSSLQGKIQIPSSKSHTLRAILFASLAKGTSTIEQFLPSPDSFAMIEAVRLLGATVTLDGETLRIVGCDGTFRPASDVIQCGNSGLVLRLIGALAGQIPHYTILTGDASIRKNRPVKPLLSALQQLGAFAISSRGDDHAPIVIKGPFTKERATLDGQDSQPVSGLLIAGAFAKNPIELHVENPGEKPWIDLTCDWFRRLGIPYLAKDYTDYRMEGSSRIEGFSYTVSGDFSSAAFPIAAAIATNSELTLSNIDMSDIQGDKAIIPLLEKMGARFEIDPIKRTLLVKKGAHLKGMRIDINNMIDALPILATVACFAKGPTEIVNGAIARCKESDRIHAIATELKKMGADIEERPDGLLIHPKELQGAHLESYHDHRIAMSLIVAALAAKGESSINGIECIAKTYPTFFESFQSIGAKVNRCI